MDQEEQTQISLKETIQYFLTNKMKSNAKLEKIDHKHHLDNISTISSTNGLPPKAMIKLAQIIIFTDCYDLNTRKKLLYCLMPQKRNFPYNIIPIAVAHVSSSIESSSLPLSWRTAVLNWLYSLIRYNIIDNTHTLLHICYTSLFHMLNHLNLCRLAAKILCHITIRPDVTPYRTRIVMNLTKKPDFSDYVASLLRCYQVFRPDLVVFRVQVRERQIQVPKSMKLAVENVKERLEDQSESSLVDNSVLWKETSRYNQSNIHSGPSAIPVPEIIIYTKTIEDKKKKLISVLQYRRLRDMTKNLYMWQDWTWPTNNASLLWRPAIIALFRPHDLRLQISITDWLEMALRTEMIEEAGKPSMVRQESLLDACIALVRYTETLVPVIYHFILEFLMEWDEVSHMSKVLQLLSCLPFTSPEMFFDNVFKKFRRIMSECSLALWCDVISALSNMSITWILQGRKEPGNRLRAWSADVTSPLEGTMFLCKRMERVFEAAVLHFDSHPLVFHQCLKFYNKVNKFCSKEMLDLPFLMMPTTQIFWSIITARDITATHRAGLMLCNLRQIAHHVKGQQVQDPVLHYIWLASMSHMKRLNLSIIIFLDACVTSKMFTTTAARDWSEILSHHFDKRVIDHVSAKPNIKHFGSICRALPYSPLVAEAYLEVSFDINNETEREELMTKAMKSLKNLHLDGIEQCMNVWIL